MNAQRSLLEEVLPRFDANEVHDVWVTAPPHVVFAAVRQVTVQEVRLLRPLEALRALPGLFARRSVFWPNPSAPVLDQFTTGVVPLGERAGTEIAAGAIGRFWRLVGNEAAVVRTREEYLSFDVPGYAKAAISSPRLASRAPAPTRHGRCCATGVRSGSGAVRFAGAGSRGSGATRFVRSPSTPAATERSPSLTDRPELSSLPGERASCDVCRGQVLVK